MLNSQFLTPEMIRRRKEELEKILDTYRATVPDDSLSLVTIAIALEELAGKLRQEASEK